MLDAGWGLCGDDGLRDQDRKRVTQSAQSRIEFTPAPPLNPPAPGLHPPDEPGAFLICPERALDAGWGLKVEN
jgi:hypothetical protein